MQETYSFLIVRLNISYNAKNIIKENYTVSTLHESDFDTKMKAWERPLQFS